MLNTGEDTVTTPLHNFNVNVKPAFPEALCVFIISTFVNTKQEAKITRFEAFRATSCARDVVSIVTYLPPLDTYLLHFFFGLNIKALFCFEI